MRGRVGVHTRHAAEAFRSELRLRVNGTETRSLWTSLSGDYRAADGWVKLHCNYPHHADAALAALDVPADRDAVTRAVAQRSAVDIEEAVVAAGGAAAALRDRDSWLAHPQGQAVRAGFGQRSSTAMNAPLLALSALNESFIALGRTRRTSGCAGVAYLSL